MQNSSPKKFDLTSSDTINSGTIISCPAYHRPSNPRWVWPARLCLFAAVMLITYNSLIPSQPALDMKYSDKVIHLLAYGALTLSLLFAAPRLSMRQIFFWPFIYGAAIELLQGQVSQGRTASIWDIFANTSGIILAILAWQIIARWKAH